ncbi:MAG: hypothetical protein P4L65_01300 [Legionella sp.]|nr:hypothetical protein [Legionella sp.]
MRTYCKLIFCIFSLFLSINAYADTTSSTRIPLISNKEVSVWKTIIYPAKEQILKLHRHENNRIVVALTGGKLKVTDNKGKVHYLTLKKDKAYYLSKDIPGELHTDENVGKDPVKVVVIELKK